MARTFYEVLGAAPDASPEAIHQLYAQQAEGLNARVARGDESARVRLWALQEAHSTLSDPARRAQYDRQLRYPASAGAAGAGGRSRRAIEGQDGTRRGAASSHSSLSNVLMIVLAVALVGAGYSAYRESVRAEEAVQAAKIAEEARLTAARIAADQLKAENEKKRLAAEALQAERNLELRTRNEAIARGNQVAAESARAAQTAAMERMRQDAQASAAKERNRQAEERFARAEQAYWSCMKSALERGDAELAKARCQGLQARR